jgi:glutamate synthase (ferredoxin)
MEVEKEKKKRYQKHFQIRKCQFIILEIGGIYRWRRSGEKHMFNQQQFLNYNKLFA